MNFIGICLEMEKDGEVYGEVLDEDLKDPG